jgi:hypothetical protein
MGPDRPFDGPNFASALHLECDPSELTKGLTLAQSQSTLRQGGSSEGTVLRAFPTRLPPKTSLTILSGTPR